MKTPSPIVFATNNAHKLAEVRAILGEAYDVKSLADIGCHDDIAETGATLDENACIKARYVAQKYGVDCFADDTGLEVEALGGEPGVRSARYAPGDGHDDKANMKMLLERMSDCQNRNARFRTVICLITAAHGEVTVEGVVKGKIAESPSGESGFGYDPVFVPEGSEKTFAQMGEEAKNGISHRRRATDRLAEILHTRKI